MIAENIKTKKYGRRGRRSKFLLNVENIPYILLESSVTVILPRPYLITKHRLFSIIKTNISLTKNSFICEHKH